MKNLLWAPVMTFAVTSVAGLTGCSASGQRRPEPGMAFSPESREKRIVAHAYNSGFPLSHDSYNAISVASDGKIYYVLSTESVDT